MTDPKDAPVPMPQDAAAQAAAYADELEVLSRQLAEAETNLVGMRDTVLRERADIENQRKRMERDFDQRLKFANEKLLRDLLPVYDGMESGLAVESATVESMREGLGLTLKALLKVAEGNGLQQIDPLNQPLDPERHHAVSVVPAAGRPGGTVVNVMQKGYLLNGRVLRPALVVVAQDSE